MKKVSQVLPQNFRRFLPPCIPPGTSRWGKMMQDEVISSWAVVDSVHMDLDLEAPAGYIRVKTSIYLYTLFERWALRNLEYRDAVQTSHSSSACSWRPKSSYIIITLRTLHIMKPECQESSLYSGKSSSGHLGIQLAKKVHDLSWKDWCCCPWFTLFSEAQTYTIVHHTHYCSLHGGYLIDRVAMVKVLYAYTDWQQVKRCQESYHMCFNCIGPYWASASLKRLDAPEVVRTVTHEPCFQAMQVKEPTFPKKKTFHKRGRLNWRKDA